MPMTLPGSMAFRNWTFQKAFSRLFVYNILFEDAEVDGQYFDLDEDSSVFGISAAGCGLASMLRFRPASIDAVDINKHHLSLAALKMEGARSLTDYTTYYDLFGRGWLPRPEKAVRQIASRLPRWMSRYWKSHHKRFNRSIYNQGLTAQMLNTLRKRSGVDTEWLRAAIRLPVDSRRKLVAEHFGPILRHPVVKRALDSPLQLLALGVNYEQRDKLFAADGVEDMVSFAIRHLQNVASTDCETNWFAWYCIAGHYNHENQLAVPPFLRRSEHEKSLGTPTKTRYHHGSIFDVLAEAGPDTWSHYSFCDAIDWMPYRTQRLLMDEVARTARPGAVMLSRSVHFDDLIERHHLQDRFVRLDEASNSATRDDRSRQYKRVDFYRLAA